MLKRLDFRISAEEAGRPLAHAVKARFPDLGSTRIRDAFRSGKISVGGKICFDPGHTLGEGEEVEVHPSRPRSEPDTFEGGLIRFQDRHVVVVEKPAGISSVPFADEVGPPSLKDRVARWLHRGERGGVAPLWVVQRLDRETSGVMMFARTEEAARNLQAQLRSREVGRRYLALVAGNPPPEGRVESYLGVVRKDGLRGTVRDPRMGKWAATRFRLLQRTAVPASLIECRLETGRTHQIRIHMAERGHPVLGDRVYGRGTVSDVLPAAPRLCLHAADLGFTHPLTGEELSFHSPLPRDLDRYLEALGGTPGRGGKG